MSQETDTSNPFWEPAEEQPQERPQQQPSNPFDESDLAVQGDESIDTLLVTEGNQSVAPVNSISTTTGDAPAEERTPTWDQIATFLLRKGLHLTALEFHTELYERGIQLPKLRDFFSNPGNFESVRDITPGENEFLGDRSLRRASSSQTLDSIDFARDPSEDDPNARVDERVAVLEFELRKAKDVIQSLREHLTSLTGSSEDGQPEALPTVNSFKPTGLTRTSVHTHSIEPVEPTTPAQPLEKRALDFLVNEYLLLNEYKLTSITFTDECQDLDFDDWDDVGLNIAKPPGLIALYRRFRYGGKVAIETPIPSHHASPVRPEKRETSAQTEPPTPGPSIPGTPTPSSPAFSPQDLIISELRSENQRLLTDLQALKQRCEAAESVVPPKPVVNADRRVNALVSLQEDPDAFALGDSASGAADAVLSQTSSTPLLSSPLTAPLRRASLTRMGEALRSVVLPPTMDADADHRRMLETISRISLKKDHLVALLAESIPHIIPNVLLSKRQEIVPLLLITILLHEDATVRDSLLHQLFNLLKKPEEQHRQMILSGCERYAALASGDRLEGELLPQCWTQISHKYAERRMLVAESCAVLAPYASPGLSGSLIISMLKQMLTEDKNAEVREKVLHSLALVCLFVNDPDKLYQLVDLLRISMADTAESVVRAALNVYLPALATWTQCYSVLGLRLIETNFLGRLESGHEAAIATAMLGLMKLVPHVYADVVKTGPWKDPEHDVVVDDVLVEVVRNRLPITDDPLEDLSTLIGPDFVVQCAKLYAYLDREWYQEWPQLKWVIDAFIPRLCQYSASLHVTKSVSVISVVDLFKRFISYFGDSFATAHVSRCMKGKIQELGANFLCHAIFVCFACAVVALGEPKQLQEFLSSALVSISDQSLPLDGLQLIFSDLADRFPEDLTQVCWAGIVHHSVPVRLNAARLLRSLCGLFSRSSQHMESLVAPLVTMTSDQEPRIRFETIPSLSALLSARIQEEKLLTVFQGFLDDREHLDIVDESVRWLAKCASAMDKKFYQEFLLPRLAVLVAQNPRLQVYRKDMAICLLDGYVTLSCSSMGEEKWLVAPVLQSLRSLLQELRELNLPEYVDIAQELSDRLSRANTPGMAGSEEIKTKVMSKIKDSGLTTMFKKK
ncbi:LisH domain and HEAT repeat-containing protein KIAA1468 [Hypsibius exemplaris]|uniref:LisH domain and HEAT repeat-containing protein KIAA1468 n=1 Tax=Hypsibius exemplaris TaxID=2072580 RepID=A0A9X6NEV4_HYPEX|nr:LisH domain and HEAT repeat-containing protein KIAA1468 [Hypsibius exemplaris]